MKLIPAFLSSSSSQTSGGKGKNKRPKGRRSLPRYTDTPSFGSSSSSDSSDFSAKAAATAPQTPRSVLGRNASCLDPEYWPSPAADLTAKCAASSSAPPPAVSELFGVFGRDGDGKVTKEELEAVFRWLGGSSDTPTEEEVAMMVAEVDRDGCISLENLGALGPALGGCHPGGGGEEEEEGLRDAFRVFDADGDGRISAEELLDVLLALGDEGCTLEDCRRMIGGVDSHGDGFVRFEDFVHMMDASRR